MTNGPALRSDAGTQLIDLEGRAEERALIGSLLRNGLQGRTAALLLDGDVGIGKSAVLDWVVAEGVRQGYRALTSRPAQSESAVPYSGLGDLLDAVDASFFAGLPEPQRQALDAALPGRTSSGDAQDPHIVGLAFLGTLRALAASGSVLVAVDDVEWFDLDSARALGFAIRRLDREPIVVVAVAPASEGTGLRLELDHLDREGRVHRIRLGALGTEPLARIVQARIGNALARPTSMRVAATAGGNPLVAIHLARAQLRDAGSSQGAAMPVPIRLEAMLREHLDALPAGAREVLLLAACLSRPTAQQVEVAVGEPDRVRGALQAAVLAGALEVDTGRLRFTHPLIAHLLYVETSANDRARAHRLLAAAVKDPEERARHLALSSHLPDADVAATLEDAARLARGRGAPDAAAELAGHSLRLSEPSEGEALTRRALAASQYLFDAGDPVQASELLRRTIAETPPGPLRAECLRRLGWVRYHAESYAAAMDLFDEARDQAGDDLALQARIERDSAWACLRFGRYRRAERHAALALHLCEEIGDPAGLSESLTACGLVDLALGRGGGPDMVQRAREAERSAEQSERIPNASRRFGLLAMWTDDLGEARDRFEAMLRRAEDRGEAASLGPILQHLSELECWTGNWSRARQLAEQAVRSGIETAQEPTEASARYALALVDAHLGDAEGTTAEVARVLDLAERTGGNHLAIRCRAVEGFLRLSLGDAAGAHERLSPLGELVCELGVADPTAIRFLPDEIEALLAVGGSNRADRLIVALESHGHRVGPAWTEAVVVRSRGLLAGTLGDLPTAVSQLETAVVLADALGQPFQLGRALLLLGQVRRRGRQKSSARQALERATATFEALGASLWAERSRAEMARVGGRSQGPLELTPTEHRVAELVATGMQNREVARALFLSVKTVEANLSRVFAKLGVRSRTELAARLAGAEGPGAHRG